ncbi:MAG: VanZ family protein [Planctomycetales bacterium]|nr:VanZ family protein [Planctomycetales bacterium]
MVAQTFKRVAAVVEAQSHAILAAYLIVLFAATHYPQAIIHNTGPLEIDKLVHVVAYAVLGFLIATWRRRGSASPGLTAILTGVMIAALIGAADEVTQPWFNRVCDLMDWAADLIGALIGCAAYVVMRRLGVFTAAQ